MIYTFKVAAKYANREADPLETVHQAHGVDVMRQAQDLLEKHPDCAGVEVLLLQTRLFFLENGAATPGAHV
jgi:hypothetical protein